MLFNSYIFVLLFLPMAVLGYYLINSTKKYRLGLAFLIGMSLWFIGYMNVKYLLPFMLSVVVTYVLVRVMQQQKEQRARKVILVGDIVFHLGMLFLFKYYNFFIENVNSVFGRDYALLHLIMPLGISFYTFQQITYCVDCYRNPELKDGFLEYAAYIAFFSQFIQGPIVLREELLPQFLDEKKKQFCAESFAEGLYAFSMGMGKKVLLADNLAKLVNAGYGNIEQLNSGSALLTILSYTLQIYFDFSGYCDMALGIGKMFGITLPINFNSPYKAESIDDFWDRWHITLTRFFTKYVYIPLGGSRKGTLRTYLNVFFIFLLSGIWHGAAWTFIIWGVLHGIAKLFKRLLRQIKFRILRMIEWFLTFLFVNAAWVFFRADSLKQAMTLLGRVFTGGLGKLNEAMYESFNHSIEVSILQRLDVIGIFTNYSGVYAVLFVLILFFSCILMKNTQEKLQTFSCTMEKLFVTVAVLFLSVISFSGISEFIYFNF